MAFSVCVWSDCPAVQRVGCKQAKRPNVWAWVWKLMCFCEGKEKYVYVRLWGGRKSTQASAKSFGLLAHQGCGRIALITLHSGAQTHTHAFSSPFSTAMARGTSTLVHMPILVCTHHYVCTNTSFSLWKTNHPKQKLMRCTNLSSSIILCKVLHITEGCHLFLLLKCHLVLPQSFSCSF